VRLAAVCAIYGGYDLVPPVPEGFDDCVLVTDVPVRSGWRNVVRPTDERPILAAKVPKFLPQDFTQCEASVWLDGSAHVRDGRLAVLSRSLLEEHELVVWDHPEGRACLYREAAHCQDWPRYADEPMRAQTSAYRAAGMPEEFGLWALGTIARRHTPRMRELGELWLAENRRWSIQDQISLPYVLWRMGLTPGTFPLDQLENDLLDWIPHAAQVRGTRRRILGLEAEIIRLGGELEVARVERANAEDRYERLLRRRAVRIALRIAAVTAPTFRFARGGRRRPPAPG
jgi:hypothetical protein